MNTIKYILIISLSLCLLSKTYSQEDKKLVVCSASIFKDMTKLIAGDLLEVETIVPIGGDPHIYEPTPKDAKLVSRADLVFINGLTFEGWIKELVENSGTLAEMITITKGIDPLKSTKYSNATDPHAWMTAVNGQKYLNNISHALIKLDPNNEAIYKNNLVENIAKLRQLDQEMRDMINTIPIGQRILVTSHDAFQYFGKQYGIQLEALMGISTDSEAQTSDIQRIINIINESKIPAIFIESTINPKLLKQIADDNNVSIGGELYADSLGEEGGEAGTYMDMLRHNVETITNALAKGDFASTKIDEDKSSLPAWVQYALLGLVLLLGMLFLILKLNK